MITGENITDEQIEALIAEQERLPDAQRDQIAFRTAYIALGRIIPSKGKTKREARAKVAEFLNARVRPG